MSIKLLANTVWRDAVNLVAATSSGGPFTTVAADSLNAIAAAEGHRGLIWKSTDATTKALMYINPAGNLTADACVLVRADYALTHNIYLRYWSTLRTPWSTAATETGFSQSLMGPRAQDYVWEFTQVANQKAWGIEFEDGAGGAWTEKAGKVYFCQAFTFGGLPEDGAIAQFSPAWRSMPYGKEVYLVEMAGVFRFTDLTQSDVDSFHALTGLPDLKQPVFLYDSGATIIAAKLWHCVIPNISIEQDQNDLYTITLETYRLRHYA